ncbi:MAG: aldo/keto reductase [Eubacterium sp.]|nr:aldo/keto reductase [Eubacterium sp.]
MQYRKDKYGNDLSVLGFGCMRFTQKAGKIDIDKAEKELMRAIELGVNYLDTAYIYSGSEVCLGEILERTNTRDKVYIATKLPQYMVKNPSDMDKYFNEQLKRLRTDHVDYYLMHMLNDVKSWQRLCSLGVDSWLKDKIKEGSIRQVGFSYHGNSDKFLELIDAYDWDFCQIQYNYLDENSQAGRTGLNYAASKGIPVIIMEPLRGGRLANALPQKALKAIEDYPVKKSPAEWGLSWLYDQKEVTVVLSGMNSVEMIEENCRLASGVTPSSLTEEDFKLFEKIIKEINANMRVGCTGCRYCMPCPKGVDIPGIFAAYNRQASDGRFVALKEYFMTTTLRQDYTGAANCIECGACEMHCPQNISIRKELKNAKRSLEDPIYKVGKFFAPFIMKY